MTAYLQSKIQRYSKCSLPHSFWVVCAFGIHAWERKRETWHTHTNEFSELKCARWEHMKISKQGTQRKASRVEQRGKRKKKTKSEKSTHSVQCEWTSDQLNGGNWQWRNWILHLSIYLSPFAGKMAEIQPISEFDLFTLPTLTSYSNCTNHQQDNSIQLKLNSIRDKRVSVLP